ncbi:MAG: hypothetical protein WCO57_10400 [Verrucomicrobiota bacterium]
MNRNPLPPDDSWESDAVWKLLDQAPPTVAGPRFAAHTVRAARLAEVSRAWWQRLFAPIPLAGLTATSAAVAIAVFSLTPSPTRTSSSIAAHNDDAFAGSQELAEAQMLSAAVDNLDSFADTEWVSLIGL